MTIEQYYNNRPETEDVALLLDEAMFALHAIGRGIKLHPKRCDLMKYADSEFLLFPSYEVFLSVNKEGSSKVERDQTFSFLHKKLGASAHKMIVIETDSVRTDDETFNTLRNYYKMEWDSLVGVYGSEVSRTFFTSSAESIIDPLPMASKNVAFMGVDAREYSFTSDKLDLAQLEGLRARFDEYANNLKRQYDDLRT